MAALVAPGDIALDSGRRVGTWRVIMDDQGNVLTVLDIGPRGSVYVTERA